MKVVTNPILTLTKEEKSTLTKAEFLLADMGRADESATLANFIMDGNWIIGDFDQMAGLIHEILNFAEDEKEE